MKRCKFPVLCTVYVTYNANALQPTVPFGNAFSWVSEPRQKRFDLHSLTHICLVDPSTLINWTSPFSILGVSGALFHFLFLFRIDIHVSKQ